MCQPVKDSTFDMNSTNPSKVNHPYHLYQLSSVANSADQNLIAVNSQHSAMELIGLCLVIDTLMVVAILMRILSRNKRRRQSHYESNGSKSSKNYFGSSCGSDGGSFGVCGSDGGCDGGGC